MEKNTDTRLAIMNTTYQLIAEHGIQKASFALIAKEVGISKPSIYYYFDSKNDMIYQLFEQFCSEISFQHFFNAEHFTQEQFSTQLIEVGFQMIQEQANDPYFGNVMKEFLSLAARDDSYKGRFIELQQDYLKGFEQLLLKAADWSLIPLYSLTEKAHILALVIDNIGNFMMLDDTVDYRNIWKTAVQLVFLEDGLHG
ncbi:TetR/AcrR family transcriptional regulator [Viridibacillus sp. YIM B01967]|uniref:TetR/AcrR family transcriptional regulator n=1 Tax=Viridibacillus soli TaxID=2798301 RepID=A0ABS1H5M7_9BACL|nr:TetR/AcrR family transcriptional regulator [Viridibacillus soli]MBK3494724.1 TetR/AcrR family transcriptional regulator [Viridibacillus soli]